MCKVYVQTFDKSQHCSDDTFKILVLPNRIWNLDSQILVRLIPPCTSSPEDEKILHFIPFCGTSV